MALTYTTRTEARLLIQNCRYPDEMQDKLMWDILVFGTDHKAVRKKYITKGKGLTFEKAQDIAHTEEATQAQLMAMDAPLVSVSVKDKTSPLKVIHPWTDLLGTQPDVKDVVKNSISEASDAQLVV